MIPITSNYTIDSILDSFKSELGKNYQAYKNHVYRVYNFSAMQVNSKESLKSLSIAAAFHDIGIWTDHTLDYLEPSAMLAKEYCVKNKLTLFEITKIEVIINNHHKLSKVKMSELAEIFRQADLIDLSLGLISKGRCRNDIKMTRAMFPNRGFHIFLLKLFLKNLVNNPTNPFPIFKL